MNDYLEFDPRNWGLKNWDATKIKEKIVPKILHNTRGRYFRDDVTIEDVIEVNRVNNNAELWYLKIK